jgi:hypothetical protein
MDAPNHLALLLAAPQPGETAMLRDQAAMAAALLARGLTSDQILTLHDPLDRLQPTVAPAPPPPAPPGRWWAAHAGSMAAGDLMP